MSRIAATAPPYAPEVESRLASMMPAGTPPIALFRTFVRNLAMTDAMRYRGGYEASKRLSLTMRDREVLIDRTCARCRCEYEWGVHVAFFAEPVGAHRRPGHVTRHRGAHDACWTERRDQLLIRAADALHDCADIDDDLWAELAADSTDVEPPRPDDACGWYHAISFTANAARVPQEPGAPRFTDVSRGRDRQRRHGSGVPSVRSRRRGRQAAHSAKTAVSSSRYSRYDDGTPSRSSSSSYCLPAK